MEDSIEIKIIQTRLVEKMHQYQRKHDIKGQCLANTQYLYDSVNASFPRIQPKAIAVIVHKNILSKECGIIDGKLHIEIEDRLIIHMVLQIGDNKIIDPSAEIADLVDAQYIGFDIPKLLKKLRNDGMSESDIKFALKQYLLFKSYAERINSGELIICDKSYYLNQNDYIQSHHPSPPL